MTLTLIVPCAGRSSRFAGQKPKYMRTHPLGNLMLIESINGIDTGNVTRLVITVVREHIDSSKIDLKKVSAKILELKCIEPEFLILENFTSSQSETVYNTIKLLNIEGSIFIKDCDNFFKIKPSKENMVCMSVLANGINATNKSYVSLDKFGNLLGIVEKSVIGDKFCVGGYSFDSAEEFIVNFEKIKDIKGIDLGEVYISHVIQYMLTLNKVFKALQVDSYCDWGTSQDWEKYTKQFKTVFVDLDGVLVVNGSEYFEPIWGDSEGLPNNINLINSMYDSGKVTVIITTSRKNEYSEKTIEQLQKIGIRYHKIIFNLPHAERILINDYSNTNPYPSASSVCIKRNEDNLKDFIKLGV